MHKFSIIIPVYNVEKYIRKCLESVFNQTYKNFEVIVVNDGTKDNSIDIVKEFDVKLINQKNQGLSAARNRGVKEATGDYIIFLDSDDYWEKDLLKNISNNIKDDPDLIRFQIKEVFEENKKEIEYHENPFKNKKGTEALDEIVKYHFVEVAWAYAIKKSYYLKEKFQFMINTYHEDFGLIPLVIIKAKSVTSIDYVGYNYLQRNNSIMSSKDYNKTIKKVEDMFLNYKFLIKEINKTNLRNNIYKSYISNSIIEKICTLKTKEYKKYKKILKEEKIYDNLLTNTKIRKIKKQLLKISPKIYFKLLGR